MNLNAQDKTTPQTKHTSALTLSTGSGNGAWMTLKVEKKRGEKIVSHHGNGGERRLREQRQKENVLKVL